MYVWCFLRFSYIMKSKIALYNANQRPSITRLDNPIEAHMVITLASFGLHHLEGGGEIAQSLESLSTKRAIRVRARLDPLLLERWNSITVLLTCSHQC